MGTLETHTNNNGIIARSILIDRLCLLPGGGSSVAVEARKTSTTGESNSFRVTTKERTAGGKGGKTIALELAAPQGKHNTHTSERDNQ